MSFGQKEGVLARYSAEAHTQWDNLAERPHLMNTSTVLQWTSRFPTSSRSWHFIPVMSVSEVIFSNRSSRVMEEVKRTLTAEAGPLNLPHRSARPLGLWYLPGPRCQVAVAVAPGRTVRCRKRRRWRRNPPLAWLSRFHVELHALAFAARAALRARGAFRRSRGSWG